MKKVLLLIDIQNGFCPGGELAVSDGNQVIPVVKELLTQGNYDLVIASQDWHPLNHKSFAINHVGKNVFDTIELNGLSQTLWPAHCIQNSRSAEFHPDLLAIPEFSQGAVKVIQKGLDSEIDSYSAFFDNGRKNETELRAYLEDYCRKHGLTKADLQIDVAGLALDYCVKFSALDAANLGYSCRLLVDATRAVNISPGDDVKALREMAAAGVEITSAREILKQEISRSLANERSQEIRISA